MSDKASSKGQGESDEIRIMLVGKTGVGKSAAGNTILGREAFEADLSSSSVTQQCRKETGEVKGRGVAVIDTPGLFDTELSNQEIIREILTSISLTSPGLHVFLVVLQLGRFTQEEKDTVELIQKTFGQRAAYYTMVLFTHGDLLRNKTIGAFISKASKDLQKFLQDCGGRYHVFNNEDESNRTQVTELLEKIDNMVLINQGLFTNDMYPEAEAAIRKEQESILREREPEIRRLEEELEKRYSGEELEKKKREIKSQEERRAREQAEMKNEFTAESRAQKTCGEHGRLCIIM